MLSISVIYRAGPCRGARCRPVYAALDMAVQTWSCSTMPRMSPAGSRTCARCLPGHMNTGRLPSRCCPDTRSRAGSPGITGCGYCGVHRAQGPARAAGHRGFVCLPHGRAGTGLCRGHRCQERSLSSIPRRCRCGLRQEPPIFRRLPGLQPRYAGMKKPAAFSRNRNRLLPGNSWMVLKGLTV